MLRVNVDSRRAPGPGRGGLHDHHAPVVWVLAVESEIGGGRVVAEDGDRVSADWRVVDHAMRHCRGIGLDSCLVLIGTRMGVLWLEFWERR